MASNSTDYNLSLPTRQAIADHFNESWDKYNTAVSDSAKEFAKGYSSAATALNAIGDHATNFASDLAMRVQHLADGVGNASERAGLDEVVRDLTAQAENLRQQGSEAYAQGALQQGYGSLAGKLSGATGIVGKAKDAYEVLDALANAMRNSSAENWHKVGKTISNIGIDTAASFIGGAAAIAAGAPVIAVVASVVVVGAAPDLLGINDFIYDDIFKPLANRIVDQATKNYTDAGHEWQPRKDPLILDLDNDGIDSVGLISSNPILFDHLGNGVKTSTGWVKPDDGFLVFDRNNDGIINNGSELFGDSTPKQDGTLAKNGFDALSTFDTNNDFIVNSQDVQWGKIMVWRDLNQDGVSQESELNALADLGIDGFNIIGTPTSVLDSHGNLISMTGNFIKANGGFGLVASAGHMADIDLVQDAFNSKFSDSVPIHENVASLPQLAGSGVIRNLHEAASLDNFEGIKLRSLLLENSLLSDRTEIYKNSDALLFQWALTGEMQTSIDINKTPSWIFHWHGGSPSPSDYKEQSDITAIQAFQKDDPDFYKKLLVLELFNGKPIISRLVSKISSTIYSADEGNYAVVISQDQKDLFVKAYNVLKIGIFDQISLSTRLASYSRISKYSFENGEFLGDGSAIIDLFEKKLESGVPNTLIDLIDFSAVAESSLMLSKFGGWAVVARELYSAELTSDLVIALHDRNIPIPGQESYSINPVSSNGDLIFGGDKSEQVSAGAGEDKIFGMSGDDILHGDMGSDVLSGGIGKDVLYGGDHDDVLDGGRDNDYLSGDAGNDTYVLRVGSGIDQIWDYDLNTIQGNDTIRFEDVKSTEVTISRVRDDLVLMFGSGDQTTVTRFFESKKFQVENFTFSDGVTWDIKGLLANNIANTGTENSDTIVGYNDGNNRIYGLGGNDTISGGNLNDWIDGGTGNDSIAGAAGNDQLLGGLGADVLTGEAGDDTLFGGEGGDTLSGNDQNDILNGGDGNDYLYGNNNDDLLDGGRDNDYLSGDAGNDIYVLRVGSGIDQIWDYDLNTIQGNDTIRFEDVKSTEVTIGRVRDDLVLMFGSGDQTTVTRFFESKKFQVENFSFTDIEITSYSELLSRTNNGALNQSQKLMETLGFAGEGDFSQIIGISPVDGVIS